MTDPTESSPGEAAPLRVVVDLNRCQGYAQCCYAAPGAFEVRGHEILFYDPAPPRARRGEIERAVQACPVRAISLQVEFGDAS
ncbi:ferredoxin [Methylobacterium sp. Leaf99]|jgi:ferredoxin|uniref:ferredoxin n=1 Tax=Methylobacterium sp. Leaf99 TaxID=1736251 RepID=UPI0006F33874|nr:ferredoxin [Methylobacterium sp. Leaf99]KQP07916.1 ferredoxin [Methylobacterium sp. Leaf99]